MTTTRTTDELPPGTPPRNRTRRRLAVGAGVLVASLGLLALLLPTILRAFGYHPHYDRVAYDLDGMRALVIATNVDTLGDTGRATGVYGSELTIPYYEFVDAGMDVDVASPAGGVIPFEPVSLRWPMASEADRRYLDDPVLQEWTENSLAIADVDVTEYDVVFMAGGWGAAYDLGTSEAVGQAVTDANAAGILIGSVCHGALGFVLAEDVDGSPLVEGRTVTGVTDKQVDELNIAMTPQHPEEEMRRLGADFVAETGFRDFFATYVAVDGNLVTGQNQNSSGDTAQTLLAMLAEEVGQ